MPVLDTLVRQFLMGWEPLSIEDSSSLSAVTAAFVGSMGGDRHVFQRGYVLRLFIRERFE